MSVELRCSFCSRSATEVRKLVAGGGGGHICDACVTIAARIIRDSDAGTDARTWWRRALSRLHAAVRRRQGTSELASAA